MALEEDLAELKRQQGLLLRGLADEQWAEVNEKGDGRAGEGGVLDIMHGRSRMTIDPCFHSMPGRSTSGFHLPGRHCFAPSMKRREVLGESHEGRAGSC